MRTFFFLVTQALLFCAFAASSATVYVSNPLNRAMNVQGVRVIYPNGPCNGPSYVVTAQSYSFTPNQTIQAYECIGGTSARVFTCMKDSNYGSLSNNVSGASGSDTGYGAWPVLSFPLTVSNQSLTESGRGYFYVNGTLVAVSPVLSPGQSYTTTNALVGVCEAFSTAVRMEYEITTGLWGEENEYVVITNSSTTAVTNEYNPDFVPNDEGNVGSTSGPPIITFTNTFEPIDYSNILNDPNINITGATDSEKERVALALILAELKKQTLLETQILTNEIMQTGTQGMLLSNFIGSAEAEGVWRTNLLSAVEGISVSNSIVVSNSMSDTNIVASIESLKTNLNRVTDTNYLAELGASFVNANVSAWTNAANNAVAGMNGSYGTRISQIAVPDPETSYGVEPSWMVTFGSATVDLNPFSNAAIAAGSSWLREFSGWIIRIGFFVMCLTIMGQYTRSVALVPQTRGQAAGPVGPANSAVSLVMAGLIMAFIIAVPMILELIVDIDDMTALTGVHPFLETTGIVATAIYLIDKVFPIGIFIYYLANGFIFRLTCQTVYMGAVALVRFMVG